MPKHPISGYKYKSGRKIAALARIYKPEPFFERKSETLNAVLIPDLELPAETHFAAPEIIAQSPENARIPASGVSDAAFELGLWLSGLESFLNARNQIFVVEDRQKISVRDWTKEFRITHATLLRCSSLGFRVARAIGEDDAAADEAIENVLGVTLQDLRKLLQALRESILLSAGILRSQPLNIGEWTAWNNALNRKLKESEAFSGFVKFAEREGENFYPQIIKKLIEERDVSAALKADLNLVLPRIGRILKWLDFVRQMIYTDQPLKPAVLIYARVYEQIRELTGFINNRLLRCEEKESEFFGTLDGAAYVASIELRKVYQSELIGLNDIRPSPLVRAKIEASHGLLNDSFQQTLVSFAQLVAPEVNAEDIFPEYQIKREQSLILRQDLWEIMQEVQNAEQNPETYPLDDLKKRLKDFTRTTMSYLIYKDWETVERFVEEVTRTDEKKDIVPILHRFGAYLETLFGQINMRGVLAGDPFEP